MQLGRGGREEGGLDVFVSSSPVCIIIHSAATHHDGQEGEQDGGGGDGAHEEVGHDHVEDGLEGFDGVGEGDGHGGKGQVGGDVSGGVHERRGEDQLELLLCDRLLRDDGNTTKGCQQQQEEGERVLTLIHQGMASKTYALVGGLLCAQEVGDAAVKGADNHVDGGDGPGVGEVVEQGLVVQVEADVQAVPGRIISDENGQHGMSQKDPSRYVYHGDRSGAGAGAGLGANSPDSNEDGGEDAGGRGLANHATENPVNKCHGATQQGPNGNWHSWQAPCGIRSSGALAGGRRLAHFSRPLSSGSGSGTAAARTAEGRATASTTTDFLGQERLTGAARARPAGLKELRIRGAACASTGPKQGQEGKVMSRTSSHRALGSAEKRRCLSRISYHSSLGKSQLLEHQRYEEQRSKKPG